MNFVDTSEHTVALRIDTSWTAKLHWWYPIYVVSWGQSVRSCSSTKALTAFCDYVQGSSTHACKDELCCKKWRKD